MRANKWTVGLAAAGLVSLPSSLVQAEERANPVLTALSSTTISGYVDVSAHWAVGSGNGNPPPYHYNTPSKQDGFNLNKVKVRIDKPLDEATWAAGYRADLLFGPDANVFGTASSFANVSDFAIQQAYVALRTPILPNGLDFKAGVFDSIIGYESHDSVNNPNYTRSYAVGLEPHTHTGLLATYQVMDALGVAVGIGNTMGPTINGRSPRAESQKTYMGSVAFTIPEDWGFLTGSTIYAGAVEGFGAAAPEAEDQANYYIGATIATPVTGVRVGAAYDYVNDFSPGGLNLGHAKAYSGYVSFQATEKMSLHARAEYADAFLGLADGDIDPGEGAHFDVFAVTGTVEYELWANVLSRLELRWDHAADGSELFGGDPGGSPGKKNEFLVAANLVYKF
jgi:hypothetical protein